MIKLYDKLSAEFLGTITDEELQFLIDNLEEESLTDVDYYLNKTVLDSLKAKGMSDNLTQLLESAMSGKNEVEIRYERIPSDD
jgi:hypothetical protein